jgi:hypothetical protein
LLQWYEINRSRPEARSLQRWDVTAAAVDFPHAQQAAELRRFVDRPLKPNAKKEKAFSLVTTRKPSWIPRK